MVKNLHANAGDVRDLGSIPGSGRFPGEGNGNLLQYSCLENWVGYFLEEEIGLRTETKRYSSFICNIIYFSEKLNE